MTLADRAYCTAHGWGPDPCRECAAGPKPKPDVRAMFEAALNRTPTNGHTDADDDLRAMLLDWSTFWTVERAEAEWIAEPIIPAKRSVALFAPGGTGKSLLALWLAAAIATGRPVFGRTNPPVDVLYLDYEMTADDLAERLEAMGYGPDDDLTRLHYALLPSLPGLDQPEGGKAVVRLAQLCEATLVVVDTFGRAAHGDENEADTVRNWYRWTGLHLKAEGRGFIRIDHAGKDLDRGQRGSSAKNDDVDVVWQMTRQDGDTFRLAAKKRRMSWIPETVDLLRREDPVMEYALLSGITSPPGTADCIRHLDELGVTVGAGYRTAADALRAAGHSTRAAVIRSAQRTRRDAVDNAVLAVDKPVDRCVRTNRDALDRDALTGLTQESTDDLRRTHRDAPSQSKGGSVRISDTDSPPDRPLDPRNEPF